MAMLIAVLLREDYPTRVLRSALGQPTPIGETAHYQAMVRVHTYHLAQISEPHPARLALVGDSVIENWMTAPFFANSLNLGIGRDTTEGVLQRIDQQMIPRAQTWLLAVGVNDILRGQTQGEIDASIRNLATTFAHAEFLIWKAILPVGREDWTEDHEKLRIHYNARARAMCGSMPSCIFLPMPIGYQENLKAWTTDGLHPNTDGYKALTQQLTNILSSFRAA